MCWSEPLCEEHRKSWSGDFSSSEIGDSHSVHPTANRETGDFLGFQEENRKLPPTATQQHRPSDVIANILEFYILNRLVPQYRLCCLARFACHADLKTEIQPRSFFFFFLFSFFFSFVACALADAEQSVRVAVVGGGD